MTTYDWTEPPIRPLRTAERPVIKNPIRFSMYLPDGHGALDYDWNPIRKEEGKS
jgi:hypothetical protein